MQAQTLTLSPLEALKVRRLRLGWTQNQLSDAAGYAHTYGSHVQRGLEDSPQAVRKMFEAIERAEREAERDGQTREAA